MDAGVSFAQRVPGKAMAFLTGPFFFPAQSPQRLGRREALGGPLIILSLVVALALWTAAVVVQAPGAGQARPGAPRVGQAGNAVGSCTSIYDVQYTADPGVDGTYPSPCAGRMARVRGVVFWVVDDRYFLAEDAGPWHGIYVYGNRGYTPVVGDEVEVVGTIQEYYGMTEFAFATTTLVGSGRPLPGATPVKAADLPYGQGGLSEPFEGVLVEVRDVQVTALEGYNIWAFTDASGGVAKADDWFYHAAPVVGEGFAALRGPVVYDFDEYKIVPREAGDVESPRPVSNSDTDPGGGEPSAPAERVPIYQIQGSGFRSPYEGARVTTTGVVLGFFKGNTPGGSSFDGFYIQDLTGDGNAATSDGLLVNHGARKVPVRIGDRVMVTGWVEEYNDYGDTGPACETQIVVEGASDIERQGAAALPPAIVLDPPGDPEAARVYFESLEGMTVTLPVTGAVVGPTSYGTILVVPGDEGVGRLLRGSPQQGMAFGVRPEERYGSGAPPLLVGSVVTAVNGPLAYTYGNYIVADQDGYGVEFAQPEPIPVPGWPGAAAHEFTVATFNACDFFDVTNDPVTDDGVESPSDYDTHKAKLAKAIAQAGCPLFVALQEVENLQVLEDLARVLEADHGCPYTPFLEEGLDQRGIDVAALVATDRVVVESVAPYQDCTSYDTGLGQGICPDGHQNLYPRPPLVVTATVQHADLPSAGARVVWVVNHLKSKIDTEGDPESAQWRQLQAESLARLAARLVSDDPDASLMVLGDLNDLEDSAPLNALYATAGLTNTWYALAPDERYSYIYQGISQALDHILISQDLQPLLTGVFALHVNADMPYSPYAYDATGPHRSSDHDLVVATFQMGWPQIVSLDLAGSTERDTWVSLAGDLDSGYAMALSCAVPAYAVNSSAVETNNPLPAGLYGFRLDPTSTPDGFLDYWASRGVVDGTSADGFALMEEIIHGQSPAFYLGVTDGAEGKEYRLVDGFARDFGQGVDEFWRIEGSQPGGTYHYVGVIEDEAGLTNTVELDLTLLAPDLAITQRMEPVHAWVYPGDPVTYSVHVINEGTTDASDVYVTDTLPPGIEGSDLAWVGDIHCGEPVLFTIPATVSLAPEFRGSTLTNTVQYRCGAVSGWDEVVLTVARAWRTHLPIILRLE